MSCFLKSEDIDIYNLIHKEQERQSNSLGMIASENFTYKAVMEAAGSILTNKYAEGYPSIRYYSGCKYADKIENIAIERAKTLFSCDFANVQPHSGSQANQAVYNALLSPGDKILGMDLLHGGHLTHGASVSSTGKNYNSFFYGVGDDGYIDYNRILDIAKIVRPKIIICGASAYSREINFKAFREIADSVNSILMSDMAHISGLVAAKEHPSPLQYSHVVTSTTHKTLRGTRGGLILSNNSDIFEKINKSVFPGIQGGPLMHIVAAKAVGFKENLKKEWKSYIKQVKANAKIIASTLSNRGYDIITKGTDNHLLNISFLDKTFSGKDAQDALERCGISTNKEAIPGDKRAPHITSGLRIGSPSLTSRGFKEDDFLFVSNKIADILDDINNHTKHKKIKQELLVLAKKHPIL